MDVGLEWVDPAQLHQHPDNPNNGDIDAIVESIRVNGFYAPIIAQHSTGAIVAGNHRWAAAMQLGLRQVPVAWIEADDESAKRIMLADNRINRKGRDDPSLVFEALSELYATDAGFAGTGYNYDDYTRMQELAEQPYVPIVELPPEEPEPEPEPDEERPSARKRLPFSLLPEAGEDGTCEGVWVTRVGYEPLSKSDFNNLRVALGAMPLTDVELATYEIPGWGSKKG